MAHLLAPLPGTRPPVRGLFVDRWGTLFRLPEKDFVHRWEQVQFIEGSVDALFRAQQSGWNLYLIGNEEAVAHGKVSDRTWAKLERELLDHLSGMGVNIRRNYACLDHPQGKPPHKKPSVFLLPDTGALYHAAQVDGVELTQSWVIGDSTLELACGERAGCNVAAVRTGLALEDRTLDVEPAMQGEDLADVIGILLSLEAYARS